MKTINLDPDPRLDLNVSESEHGRDHGCDWHDILMVSECVGMFCAIVLLITLLVLLIMWHA